MSRMKRTAVISPCGEYRYVLGREWSCTRPRIKFIGLNPSTADAEQDDPTVRRLIGFAKSWGYGSMSLLNLFALRSTDPGALLVSQDPVGPANDEWVLGVAGVVVACWGVHGALHGRGDDVLRKITDAEGEVLCFGLTKDGHPKHPLYLPASATLEPLECDGLF